MNIGQRVLTHNFGWAVCVSEVYYKGAGRSASKGVVDVKFDNTGAVRNGVMVLSFLQGCFPDNSFESSMHNGSLWNTTNYGQVEVVNYESADVVYIKFLNTGNIKSAQRSAILAGLIKDTKEIERKASEESCAKAIRLRVREVDSIKRKIGESAQKEKSKIRADALQTKKQQEALRLEAYAQAKEDRKKHNQQLLESALIVEDVPLDQSKPSKALQVDFKDRQGNWVLRFSMRDEFVQTRLGRLHNNITQRTKVGGSYQELNPKYEGVTLGKTFKDPQKFCDWAVSQPGWGLGYDLDKDLFGGRQYSPRNCCFLPNKINSAITHKPYVRVAGKSGLWEASASINNSKVTIGKFNTKEDATQACINFKKLKLKKYAEEFKATISVKAYEKLINF